MAGKLESLIDFAASKAFLSGAENTLNLIVGNLEQGKSLNDILISLRKTVLLSKIDLAKKEAALREGEKQS